MANVFQEGISEGSLEAEDFELTEVGERASQAFNAESLLVDNEEMRAKWLKMRLWWFKRAKRP